jgi:DNA-binding SARP family transcriptional activator
MSSFPNASPLLRVSLLGGFRVERGDDVRGQPDWPRRSAKTLTKLLAVHPAHALHREQIIDVLWPEADADSALNSFGKALHVARRVLEPGLVRWCDSSYLQLADCVLVLNTKRAVIDADVFERLARDALQSDEASGYQAALAAYHGELLPEDMYEPWCADRRSALAELHVRLLIGLADVYERCGACKEAADRLREAIGKDPTREAAHRQLMRLYARMGTPDQAVRQFHACEELLRRELDMAPQAETISLWQAIQASRQPPAAAVRRREQAGGTGGTLPCPAADSTFIGRTQVLQFMSDQLTRSETGRASMIVISGEAGVGKTRLLEELALRAIGLGAVTLRCGRGAHATRFSCGALVVALEDYAARLRRLERLQIARRYPALAWLVPSLRSEIRGKDPGPGPRDYQLDLIPSVAQFLGDLARVKPVLLLLGDLHEIDGVGLDLVRYLAHLAVNEPLLIAGVLRDLDMEYEPRLRRMSEAMTREGLWVRIELHCLSRRSTDQLVRALLPDIVVSDALLAEIYEQSRGNPLFVRELADAMRGDPSLLADGQRDSAWFAARLPTRARTLTDLRLSLMDKPLRQVLGLAAMAGDKEISVSQLRAGAEALEPPLPPAALLDALDCALRMHLLEEWGGGYAFRHPVVRTALVDSLPRHRRDEFRAALATHRTGHAGLRARLKGGTEPAGRGAAAGSVLEPVPGMFVGTRRGLAGFRHAHSASRGKDSGGHR